MFSPQLFPYLALFPTLYVASCFFLPLDIQVNGGVLDLAYTQHSSKRVRKGGAIYGLTMALPRILRNPANSFSAALRYRMLFKIEELECSRSVENLTSLHSLRGRANKYYLPGSIIPIRTV